MIANLMMYQRPQLIGPHDRFWKLIRKYLSEVGIDSPENLSQDAEAFYVWKHPELILSQTCGMPFRTWLHNRVNLVGTPDYGLESCPAGYYRSAIVVRAREDRTTLKEFRNATFAYNQTFSQSGYAAPFWHLKKAGFWFEKTLQTHHHVLSAKSVADGQSDIASIDAVTWRNILTYESFSTELRVLEWTTPSPGLPLITSLHQDPDAIFCAVKNAVAALSPDDQSLLGVKGIVRIHKMDYLAIQNPD